MKPSPSGPKGFRGQEGGISKYCNDNLNDSLNIKKLITVFFRFFSPFLSGILKFVLLCDIFTKHKSDLSREERQEIIQHCRKRCEIRQSQTYL